MIQIGLKIFITLRVYKSLVVLDLEKQVVYQIYSTINQMILIKHTYMQKIVM